MTRSGVTTFHNADYYPRRVKAFWEKVNKTDGCWLWTGYLNPLGYGRFSFRGVAMPAHRFGFQAERGPIQDGLTLDHLCRNPSCVRPDHLEPVTLVENIRRGISPPAMNKRKTHCPAGHQYVEENIIRRKGTPEHRSCHACYILQRGSKMPGIGRGGFHRAITHCPRGHEYTEENTYRQPSKPTTRKCRECNRISSALARKEKP